MSNKLTDAFDGKLQYEIRNGVDRTPIQLDKPTPDLQCDKDRLQYLKDKFHVSSLQMEGRLGRALGSKSLAEHCDNVHRERRIDNQERLMTSVASWNNHTPVRMWLTIGR